MVYNMTIIANNATTIVGLMQGVDTVLMQGWLGTLLLLGLCGVFMIAFYQTTGNKSQTIIGTSFICMILAILLRAVNLLPNKIMIIAVIIAAISMAFSWKDQS